MEKSKEFSTVKDLNKSYKEIRDQILFRHGIKEGQKVRLKNAIMMYINFGNGFIECSSVFSDMKDKVKMYETLDNRKVTFLLMARA